MPTQTTRYVASGLKYWLSSIHCLSWIPFLSVLAVAEPAALPKPADGWSIELITQAPSVLFPTAAVVAPDGTIYVGQDPMDMPGPTTRPIDSVVAIHPNGSTSIFVDGLWAVMGLEWIDDTLYVDHAPYLSAFKDTDGDGKADKRTDLVTGLGPPIPGFSGINDHVVSGMRLGMDGFLTIAVGDKGIPRAVGKDGKTIQLKGGGVIRVRPDGHDLEVVSTGERNPLSVSLNAFDEIFTYGNDDDSKRWPNSLTHHIVGGHYGYPYEFLTAPRRALPILAGEIGGSGAQSICYEEAGLPTRFRGNLFVCDWGLQTVFRYVLERKGATYRVVSREPIVTKGALDDFRPFSIAADREGRSLIVVDWAYTGWLADGPKTGRVYRLTYSAADRVASQAPRPEDDLAALGHPARSVRLSAQRALTRRGQEAEAGLIDALKATNAQALLGRIHALWALDGLGTPTARRAIREALDDPSPELRAQAARSIGIRRDGAGLEKPRILLRDPDPLVRREVAIAMGRIGQSAATPALLSALEEQDEVAAWAIRGAIRGIGAWDVKALVEVLTDPKRQEQALRLTDEVWAAPVVDALVESLSKVNSPMARAGIVANLAGLYRGYPPWSGSWFGTNPLAGEFPRKTEPWDKTSMERVFTGLRQAANDDQPEVRKEAYRGLANVGLEALAPLRNALLKEADESNLVVLCAALATGGDTASVPVLAGIALDGQRTLLSRRAALEALERLPTPDSLRARLSVVYSKTASPELIAAGLPSLGRDRVMPANDLATFLEDPRPIVRESALRGLANGDPTRLGQEARAAILFRLKDDSPFVRAAACEACGALRIQAAVPVFISILNDPRSPTPLADSAARSLCALPDTRALESYLALLEARDQDRRQSAESALMAIREQVRPLLITRLESGKLAGPAAMALERILATYEPITSWKVIGPFARTTAQVFVGEASIDFSKQHGGVEGRPIRWHDRKADPETGRVTLNDFKGGLGDRGGFGYDVNGSPDLAAFAFAQIISPTDRYAFLRLGSSGTINVYLNDQPVWNYANFAGRPFKPDSDVVKVKLVKGSNRLLIRTRQGIGVWSIGAWVSEVGGVFAPRTQDLLTSDPPGQTPLERLREFALRNPGDVRAGEALFFDAKGVGCVKCHQVGDKGNSTIGPNLAGLAAKYDKAELVRSVLEPSNRIATGYQPVLIATSNGQVLTGLIRSETEAGVELVDAEAKSTIVPKGQIEERRISEVSIMPAGQVDGLSPREFADLIAYLQGLTTPTNAVKP